MHGEQDARVESAAGVQHNFPAELFPTDAGQFLGHAGNLVVRSSNQDHARQQELASHPRASLSCAYKSNGLSCTRFAARDNAADSGPSFAQAAAQGPSDASRTDDAKTPRI